MRIARRQRAEPHQGQRAGRIDEAHEFGKAGAGFEPGIDQPAAAIKQRPLRRRDHLDRLGDPRRIGLCLRSVALMRDLLGPDIIAQREQDVLWQIDKDRPRPPAFRHVKRLVQNAREVVDVLHQIIVLGAGPGDAGRVGFLKGVIADQMRRHLARETHDRHRVHQRVGEAGHGVCRAGPARHQDDPDLPGRAGIAFRSMHRAPLLAHQDVAQRVLLEQGVVDRQDRAPGIAEYDIDALIDERLDDDIRSTDRLGRHDRLLVKVLAKRPVRSSLARHGGWHRRELGWMGQQELVN